jgi:hypothetical protein
VEGSDFLLGCLDRFFFLDDLTGFEITYLLEVNSHFLSRLYNQSTDIYTFMISFKPLVRQG